MAEELSELLREFEEVMEDFARGPASQYQQHLEELKRKAGQRVYDSGIDELESECGAGREEPWGGWCLPGWELRGSSMEHIFLLMLPGSALVGWMSNEGMTTGYWPRTCQHLPGLLVPGRLLQHCERLGITHFSVITPSL